MKFSLACCILLLGEHVFANFHPPRFLKPEQPRLRKRASPFYTNKTKPFWVNGSAIPEVPFDIGESYAGLLPISKHPEETRKLWFWFFPSTNPNATNEVTLWLNGGPGCSSLIGLLTENGPFTWLPGTFAPVQNPYSWTNLTNMLWIEQPVGVGFTQGVPNITNEVELGLQFIGFYKNFVDTFDVHKYKVYLTGESYAGRYIPYIADAFITANNTDYYNLKGTWVNSPLLGDQNIQRQVGLVPFANYWNKLLYYNETFLSKMNERAISCKYIAYMDKYLTFPPPQEKFPVLPAPSASNNYRCDVFFNLRNAAYDVNPCFNYYRISELCPHPYSVIRPTAYDYSPPGMRIYFNRSDVQSAINAPPTNWVACTDVNVFANQPVRNTSDSGSDQSLGPAQNEVLRRVIEFNNNTIIGSGDLDMILATNATLLTVQNVTWNGLQGFQSYPGQPLYVPPHPEYNDGALAAFGIQGSWGRERGLTFFRVQLGGHELPGWAPGVAYRALELLLGRVKSLDESAGPFTTLPGNFTGTSPIYKRAAGDFMRDRRRRVEL